MAISLIDFFKKTKERLFPAAKSVANEPAAPAPIHVAKPAGQRLSKTVLPNTPRARMGHDVYQGPDRPGGNLAQKASATSMHAARQSPMARGPAKTIAMGSEPKAERTISLQLSDILDQLPGGCIKSPESFDPARTLRLKASEIEKGMAQGKPSVPLASLYLQAPDIFREAVVPDDPTLVLLPLDKVLAQFNNVQVRTDQVADGPVPQIDTPILAVTREDTERFGTSDAPIQASLAETAPIATPIAEAEPSPPTIPFTHSDTLGSTAQQVDAPESEVSAASPPKIPFHLPPNGTGVPGSERVPASGGPPVPTPPASPIAPGFPFKITPPPNALRPKFTLVPGVEPLTMKTSALAEQNKPATGDRIALSLQTVLQELPPFQLNGSPWAVPEDARVEFPLSLIEPQLSSGRVIIPARIFQRAIPEMYRVLFVVDPSETPVALPLQEILAHLPADTLQMRNDQEQTMVENKFTTPFSIEAERDANRFQPTTAPSETVQIDPQEILARANGLPGVAACAITFADGLSLAGNMPADLRADAISALAPALLQKIESHLPDTTLGALQAMTLHCANSALTFFLDGNICLAALHSDREAFSSDTRDRLTSIVQDLSRIYSQPEPSHVHH